MKKILKSIPFVSSWRMLSYGYLKKTGWKISVSINQSVDDKKNAIPWFTYPSIRFLEGRLTNKLNVFEYGSGNSTIWLSKRTKKVDSVEHDKSWFDFIYPKISKIDNVNYAYKNLENKEYANSILESRDKYEVIIIDGRDRINCCKASLQRLTVDGLIIWDNSDRGKHKEAYKLLEDKGFKRLDFWGIGPIGINEWCTTVFYRESNCFNL